MTTPGSCQASLTAQSQRSRAFAAILTLALCAAVVALALVLASCGDDTPATGASESDSASPSPTVIPSPTGAAASTIAAVTGRKSDTLVAMDTSGGSVVLVPGDGRPLSNVQWSPDGKRIAYLKHDYLFSWETTLMVYDVAGGGPVTVSFGDMVPEMIYGYTWVSPTELVAAAYPTVPKKTKSNGTLYRCDVAGGTAAPLTDSSGVALQGMQPSASADGHLLAYVGFSAGGSAGRATEMLELLDVASGSVKHVRSAQTDMKVEGMDFDLPLISPDGEHIFTRQMSIGPGFVVRIYGADGTEEARLPDLSYPGGAAWDPSGSGRVVFGGHIAELRANRIIVYDPRAAGTGEFVPVIDLKKQLLFDFAWSPDGQWIVYSTISPRYDYETDDLAMVRRDGTGNTPIMKDTGYPSWAGVTVPQPPASGSTTPAPSASP